MLARDNSKASPNVTAKYLIESHHDNLPAKAHVSRAGMAFCMQMTGGFAAVTASLLPN